MGSVRKSEGIRAAAPLCESTCHLHANVLSDNIFTGVNQYRNKFPWKQNNRYYIIVLGTVQYRYLLILLTVTLRYDKKIFFRI